MPVPRIEQLHAVDPAGLAAFGRCGVWEVSIEQETSGRERWFVEIEGTAGALRLQIGSFDNLLSTVAALRHETRQRNGSQPESRELFSGERAQLRIVRDDEFADRCFLLLDSDEFQLRLTVAGNDLVHLCEAFDQAVADLDDSVGVSNSSST